MSDMCFFFGRRALVFQGFVWKRQACVLVHVVRWDHASKRRHIRRRMEFFPQRKWKLRQGKSVIGTCQRTRAWCVLPLLHIWHVKEVHVTPAAFLNQIGFFFVSFITGTSTEAWYCLANRTNLEHLLWSRGAFGILLDSTTRTGFSTVSTYSKRPNKQAKTCYAIKNYHSLREENEVFF